MWFDNKHAAADAYVPVDVGDLEEAVVAAAVAVDVTHDGGVEERFVFGDADPRGELLPRNAVFGEQLSGKLAALVHLAPRRRRQRQQRHEHRRRRAHSDSEAADADHRPYKR